METVSSKIPGYTITIFTEYQRLWLQSLYGKEIETTTKTSSGSIEMKGKVIRNTFKSISN